MPAAFLLLLFCCCALFFAGKKKEFRERESSELLFSCRLILEKIFSHFFVGCVLTLEKQKHVLQHTLEDEND